MIKNLLTSLLTLLLVILPCLLGVEDPPPKQDTQLYSLVSGISKRFDKPFEEILAVVELAKELGHAVFPTHLDILSVIWVESEFNQEAEHRIGPSQGLMQINKGVHGGNDLFNTEENLSKGAALLREYGVIGGSGSYALIAYNAGPRRANKICGKRGSKLCSSKYSDKVKRAKKELERFSNPNQRPS